MHDSEISPSHQQPAPKREAGRITSGMADTNRYRVVLKGTFIGMTRSAGRKRSASVYGRYVRAWMRRHPAMVSVLVFVALIWASDARPIILLSVFLLSLAALGIAAGARRRIPARDLLLYVVIGLLVVVAAVVAAVWGSSCGVAR